jgi:hypothetical protein
MKKFLSNKLFLIPFSLVLITVVAASGYFIFTKVKDSQEGPESSKTAKFVTASPVDFEQMEAISKFRSCSGHDYSGLNIKGETESERSMKHYAVLRKDLENTTNQVKIFAPFDAVVINNSVGKLGDNLDLSPTAAPGWVYELGHISALGELKEGSTVKSGELIGYYNGAGAFDLQFWFGDKNTVNTTSGKFDSIFAHMTPEFEKTLEPYGLSSANLIVSKEERDADPCKSSGVKDLGSTIFASDRDKDMIVIKHKDPAHDVVISNNNSNPQKPSGIDECAKPVGQRPPGCK